MKTRILFSLILAFIFTNSNAQFATPNTGVNWTLDSIAYHSPTTVTVSGNEYTLHEDLMIEENDSLSIIESQTLKIASGKEVGVKGFFKSDGMNITGFPTTHNSDTELAPALEIIISEAA